MSARGKIYLYGAASQRNFSQDIARKLLYQKGFVLNRSNINCLYPHNRKETLKHWLTKAIIFHILRSKGRNVGTEIEVGNSIVDVFDSNNKIAYEVENNFSKLKIEKKTRNLNGAKDVFFINLHHVPNEINVAKKYLERIVV